MRVVDATPQMVSTLLHGVGEARIRVAGTSMLPAIRPADVLLIRQIAITCVAVGDVVLIARDGRLFAHRVVRTSPGPGECVITRGDAHAHDDPPADASMLVGRVEGLLRNGIEIPIEAPARRRIAGGLLARLLHFVTAIRRKKNC